MRDLVKKATTTAGVTPAGPETDGEVEVTRRRGDGRSYLFVVNHGSDSVEIPTTGCDLVTGEPVTGLLRVEGGGVGVVREEAP